MQRRLLSLLLALAILASGLVLSAPVQAQGQKQTTTTYPDGCSSSEGFSSKTGQRCDQTVTTTTESSTETESALFVGTQTTSTSILVDHWSTKEQCVAATSSPFYFPSIRRNQKLGNNEIIRGLPWNACLDMEIPDRIGGRGFVKIEAGRPVVMDRNTNVVLRLVACNNNVFGTAIIGSGSSVTKTRITNNTTITRIIREDGCMITPKGDGQYEVVCGKTRATLRDGKDGTSCSVQDLGNGTKEVTCGGNTVTIADGTDGKNGWCSGRGCQIAVTTAFVVAVGTTIACLTGFKGLCRGKASEVLGGVGVRTH